MKDDKNFDGLDISKISPEGLIGVTVGPPAGGGKNMKGGHGLEVDVEDPEGVLPEDFSEIFQTALKNIINAGSQLKTISNQEENFKNGGDIFLDLAVNSRQAERGGYIPLEYQRYILCSQCDEMIKRAKAGPCLKCEGIGRVMAFRRVEVKLPKNIQEGEVLKVANEGHVPPLTGSGQASGDLFVKIVIRED